ncbi:hypothetical protein PanWU01x14_161910 [Parasponia andersonii]|uniref:Uncharacterized protein n=1 Tax=Parasponia andersonii TaxID=3476 RepID=A0A2P5CDE5_PARAD|nr:hypothetical protein PanWU01x14_161910 [Parasponia andersonii]
MRGEGSQNRTRKKYELPSQQASGARGVPPLEDNPRLEGCLAIPEPLATSIPHISPLYITPSPQPRPGTFSSLKRRVASKREKSGATHPFSQSESSQGQGPPSVSTTTKAPHGEDVLTSAPQASLVPPTASMTILDKAYLRPFVNVLSHHYIKAFSEYEHFRAQALEEKKKAYTEASKSKENEGQLRKKIESLRAVAKANVTRAWDEFVETIGPESYNAMMAATTGAEPSEGKNQDAAEKTTRGGDGGEV